MRVYEAIVKGLEGIGVEAAFGGAGENAAGLMLALKHSQQDPAGHHAARAGRVLHGLRLRDVHRQARASASRPPDRARSTCSPASPWRCRTPIRCSRSPGTRRSSGRAAGSLNETSGLNRTPDSQAMFAGHDQEVVPARPTSRTRATCSRRRSTSPSRGGPGPVHIHVPENLTHHGVEVDELPRHPARRGAGPARPGARRRRSPTVLADAIAKRQEGRGAGRLRRDPQRCRAGGQAADRALPDPAAHDARRQGHRVRGTSAVRSACSATAATASAWKAFLEADVVLAHRQLAQPARHLQLPRGPVRRTRR